MELRILDPQFALDVLQRFPIAIIQHGAPYPLPANCFQLCHDGVWISQCVPTAHFLQRNGAVVGAHAIGALLEIFSARRLLNNEE